MVSNSKNTAVLNWRKSTRSEAGNCVEVASASGMVAVRDSKEPWGPVLRYSIQAWYAFLDAAKEGEFDATCRSS
jgi:hypothetical protein